MDLTRGGTTVKLPCLDVFGSCTYNDVCSLLAPIEICPPEFMESNVPCKCPINKVSQVKIKKYIKRSLVYCYIV